MMAFCDQNQKLMQLLGIFREKIVKMDTSRYMKSESKAAELRKQGNELFVQDQFNQSIEMYTEVSHHNQVKFILFLFSFPFIHTGNTCSTCL